MSNAKYASSMERLEMLVDLWGQFMAAPSSGRKWRVAYFELLREMESAEVYLRTHGRHSLKSEQAREVVADV